MYVSVSSFPAPSEYCSSLHAYAMRLTNTQFLNELVRRGVSGGDQAAKLLKQAVIDYLRHDEDFKYDNKIVIRVYANIRGLSKTYVDNRILPNTAAFHEFVLGFNKAHPLCDFIDAGNHKEAADTKLKGSVIYETMSPGTS